MDAELVQHVFESGTFRNLQEFEQHEGAHPATAVARDDTRSSCVARNPCNPYKKA